VKPGHQALLVLEGGGSKARAAVVWNGRFLARGLPGSVNPNDVGATVLERRFCALLLPLLESAAPLPAGLRVVAAVAGAARPEPRKTLEAALASVLGPLRRDISLEVTTDALALLECCLFDRDGIIVVAGTGSICLGVVHGTHGTTTARAGGQGGIYDRGSGFALGLGVLEAAREEIATGAREPILTRMVCRIFGIAPDDIESRFSPLRRDRVAALVPAALEASDRGDRTARRLVKDAVRDLASMAASVADELGLCGGTDIVLSGGLFRHPSFRARTSRAMRRRLPGSRIGIVHDPLARIALARSRPPS
jgi:N-acetylglucosamine kinase-like BadF-type ATPase